MTKDFTVNHESGAVLFAVVVTMGHITAFYYGTVLIGHECLTGEKEGK